MRLPAHRIGVADRSDSLLVPHKEWTVYTVHRIVVRGICCSAYVFRLKWILGGGQRDATQS